MHSDLTNITNRVFCQRKTQSCFIAGRDKLLLMTLGQRIKAARKRFGERLGRRVTQSELAELCGWDQAQSRISGYENDTREPSLADLEKIAEVTGVGLSWLLTGEAEERPRPIATVRRIATYDNLDELPEGSHVLIPRVAVDLSAGNGKAAWYVEEKDPVPFMVDYVKRLGVKPQDAVMVKVSGDSMERTLFDDDSVIVDKSDTTVRDNGVYALVVGDELLVKRLFKRPGGGLLIASDNKERYPELEVSPDDLRYISIIGRVKYRSGTGDF